MSDFFSLAFIIGGLAFPFVAMPFLWRRMKKVRAQSYERAEPLPNATDWEEKLEERDNIQLARTHRANDDLIALGDKARHARWPLTND